MRELASALLEHVLGGANSTTTTEAPLYRRSTSTTDYARCVDQVVRSTAEQYPSTKPWYNPFATDTNAEPRGHATIDNMRSTCGLPPSN